MIWLLWSIIFVLAVLTIALLSETQESQAELKRLEWLNSAYPPITPEQQERAEAAVRQWELAQFERMKGK